MEQYSKAKENAIRKPYALMLCIKAFCIYPTQFFRITFHSLKKRAYKKKIEGEKCNDELQKDTV